MHRQTRLLRASLGLLVGVAMTYRAHAAGDGLDFLRPRDVAFVEVSGDVQSPAGVPAAGAAVLVYWTGAMDRFHGTNYRCMRVDAATTDARGHFTLPAPLAEIYEPGMSQQSVDVHVHVPGAEWSYRELTNESAHIDRDSVFARLSWWNAGLVQAWHLRIAAHTHAPSGDINDHLRWLVEETRASPPSCEHQGEHVGAFYAAVAQEGASLARTAYERRLAEVLAIRARYPTDNDARRAQENPLLFHDPAVRHWTVRRQNVATVYSAFIEDDPDERDSRDWTPLMRAAAKGDAAAVTHALAAGGRPNRQTWLRMDSALTLAIDGASRTQLYPPDAVKLAAYEAAIDALLAAPDLDVNLRDGLDRTPLMRARGLPHVMAALLARGADPDAIDGRASAPRSSASGPAPASTPKR